MEVLGTVSVRTGRHRLSVRAPSMRVVPPLSEDATIDIWTMHSLSSEPRRLEQYATAATVVAAFVRGRQDRLRVDAAMHRLMGRAFSQHALAAHGTHALEAEDRAAKAARLDAALRRCDHDAALALIRRCCQIFLLYNRLISRAETRVMKR